MLFFDRLCANYVAIRVFLWKNLIKIWEGVDAGLGCRTSEEVRKSIGANQTEFSQKIGLSRRTYNARLMQEQDWKLQELIKLTEIEQNKVKIQSGSDYYIVSIEKC